MTASAFVGGMPGRERKMGLDTDKKTTGPAKQGRGIDRLIDILNYLFESGKPQRPKDIATGIGAPKSTVYEITKRLVEENFLEQYDNEGRLFLGRKLHFFGTKYLEKFNLLRLAQSFVLLLGDETGETAQLCMTDGKKFVVALSHEGAQHFKIVSDLGRPIPLTWTASGRVLVAGKSDAEILDFIPEDDFVLPDGKAVAKKEFLSQVEQATRDGVFVCDSVVDRYTCCYAAPVTDQAGTCVATLCLVTPRGDDEKRRDELKSTLIGHAARLSAQLGS